MADRERSERGGISCQNVGADKADRRKRVLRAAKHANMAGETEVPSVRKRGHTLACVRHAEACAASIYGVRHEDIRAATRGPANVAWARQVAMYQCHTTLRLSLTDVGALFERDRTTVGHACRIVEDRRDDQSFDIIMTCLERTILAGAGGGGDLYDQIGVGCSACRTDDDGPRVRPLPGSKLRSSRLPGSKTSVMR